MRLRIAVVALVFGLGAACRKDVASSPGRVAVAVDLQARAVAADEARLERIELRSSQLSAFAGHDVTMHAVVWTPPGFDPDAGHPALYYVHGFGGTPAKAAARVTPGLEAVPTPTAPRFVVVFLDGSHALGHHVFADSASMGPWGTALTEELIPAIDRRYGTPKDARGHFLAGHSSGGWSSLWVMISHPEQFGGVWSTAPDPVDFRDFVGVDIYTFENAYRSPVGRTVYLEYRDGEPIRSLQDYVEDERARRPVGGQFYSFDAVFSPRRDGEPRPLFDRESGAVDRSVAEAWRSWDISWLLRTQWAQRAGGLQGKLHVIVGTEDTYGLQRPAQLLADELSRVGSDAEFVFVPGRDHGDLYDPHPDYYPDGLWAKIEREVGAASRSGRK
ncbi:MAG: alpha/beta hydrolase-fold protein [Myxococcota bacterium]